MSDFKGFPKAGLTFLKQLESNNNKPWFEAHKDEYKNHLLTPALQFVEAMGERLQTISNHIHADTRTNGAGTLIRMARDVRFSKDKSPYKTAIAGIFWEGAGKKMNCPGFGFHMEAGGMYLMAGLFAFEKDQLDAYRAAVDNESKGKKLQRAINQVSKAGYAVQGEHYKRVPKPYAQDHPSADLLRHAGLYASFEFIKPGVVTSSNLLDECFGHFKAMSPVQRWLVEALNP